MNDLFQKWVFVLFLSALALDCNAYFIPCMDTIPPPKKQEYKGYRLHLTAVKLIRQKGAEAKIQYTLINTGRENITLSNKNQPSEDILILFDASLKSANLTDYQSQIRKALLNQQLSIVAGQIKRDNELSFSTKVLAKEQAEPEVKEMIADVPKTEQEEEVKEEIEEVIAKEEETTEVVTTKASEQSSIKKEEEDYTPYLDRNNCSDLVIENLKIVKQGKRNITLEYSLINQGTGPAYLFGSTKAKEDNVAIRANISGSTRLSRGAIIIGGGYITEGLKKENGKLMPNERYVGTIKLDTYKMTKFTPNIILELDAYNALIECDETNNRSHIKVE